MKALFPVFLLLLILALLSACGSAPAPVKVELVAVTPAPAAAPSPTPVPTPVPTPRVFDLGRVELFSVDSSCFSEIGYDAEFQVLAARFRDSGKLFLYKDFPPEQWEAFTTADSLGRWYNANIKGVYEYERVD